MSRSRYEREKYTPVEKLMQRLRGEAVSSTHPMLISEWVPDSYGPDCFTQGSTRWVWWVCQNGHHFQRPICRRTRAVNKNSKFKGCPYCAGRLSAFREGLTFRFPDLAKEWQENENGKADLVHPGSRRTVRWTCIQGHEYDCMVLARTEDGQSCPQCYVGDRVNLKQLPKRATIELAQFDLDENGNRIHCINFGYDPEYLPVSHKVWWQCKVDAQHCCYRSAYQLTEANFACPQCQRREAGTLADYPVLVAQIHPNRNEQFDPRDIFAGSSKTIWWQCKKHPKLAWQSAIYKRALRGEGCPYCSNKRASANNCLSATHPHIAREWHPTRNGVLNPTDVLSTSIVVCWWLCPCGAEYSRQVCGRIRGSGCAACKLKAKP